MNNLVYFRKDLIVINSYLLFSRWKAYCGYLFIKTNFTRITYNRVSNLHIVQLVSCNGELYFNGFMKFFVCYSLFRKIT